MRAIEHCQVVIAAKLFRVSVCLHTTNNTLVDPRVTGATELPSRNAYRVLPPVTSNSYWTKGNLQYRYIHM